ncbi:MAG: hypothetical protein K9G62_06695 [Alphaproteobacteria bacterium]|nr:hypothetical protein [Alphaproteobacteria bacterium]
MPNPRIYNFTPEVSPLPDLVQIDGFFTRVLLGGNQGYEVTKFSPGEDGMPRIVSLESLPELFSFYQEMNKAFAEAAEGSGTMLMNGKKGFLRPVIINGSEVTPENYRNFEHYIQDANTEYNRLLEIQKKDLSPERYEEYKRSLKEYDYNTLLSGEDRGFVPAPEEKPADSLCYSAPASALRP